MIPQVTHESAMLFTKCYSTYRKAKPTSQEDKIVHPSMDALHSQTLFHLLHLCAPLTRAQRKYLLFQHGLVPLKLL